MSDELFPKSGLRDHQSQADGLKFDGADGGPGLFPEDAPPDDPIGPIDYPGTADGDTAATLAAVESAFAKRAKAEQERFKNATDSEYWFAMVFETREQKERFLAAMGWLELGDKYLDGIAVAEKEKVPLPTAAVPYVPAKPDRKLNELALPLEPQ